MSHAQSLTALCLSLICPINRLAACNSLHNSIELSLFIYIYIYVCVCAYLYNTICTYYMYIYSTKKLRKVDNAESYVITQ